MPMPMFTPSLLEKGDWFEQDRCSFKVLKPLQMSTMVRT